MVSLSGQIAHLPRLGWNCVYVTILRCGSAVNTCLGSIIAYLTYRPITEEGISIGNRGLHLPTLLPTTSKQVPMISGSCLLRTRNPPDILIIFYLSQCFHPFFLAECAGITVNADLLRSVSLCRVGPNQSPWLILRLIMPSPQAPLKPFPLYYLSM